MASARYSYALISKDHIVQNICDVMETKEMSRYEMANHLAKCAYGTNAYAVLVNQIPCGIGDHYRNGNFYRTDEETGESILIKNIPTVEGTVSTLVRENETLQAENNQLALALTEQYEEHLSLQQELATLRLSVTNLYKQLEG